MIAKPLGQVQLCWHVLTREEDYRWARPALVAAKTRGMELQAGPAHAYNVKARKRPALAVLRL